ncbi:uncharacterized protein THITE_2092870 [Thermothielavioides terrestris NRRL 8126]|uniref:Uncharacterized protein n=1 Tax=Thermothielavioides terrestris (strain ATCC 38088 / NRRL 8126) TaxID=578455 RepID=G2RHQ2_THETT|nr:uncharacterized protein THITE_2092870 [Thermothielavioides terrestris NRRL 8126]AEO71364.1 hypothetical protein THITE_2092870 [Thermothielavioides terrestris NRRL 8126]
MPFWLPLVSHRKGCEQLQRRRPSEERQTPAIRFNPDKPEAGPKYEPKRRVATCVFTDMPPPVSRAAKSGRPQPTCARSVDDATEFPATDTTTCCSSQPLSPSTTVRVADCRWQVTSDDQYTTKQVVSARQPADHPEALGPLVLRQGAASLQQPEDLEGWTRHPVARSRTVGVSQRIVLCGGGSLWATGADTSQRLLKAPNLLKT